MATSDTNRRRPDKDLKKRRNTAAHPGQVVLAFQGGGALGAYQAGVYEAMHEAGIEPDWVIGTSIGAINAALIAGNTVENRLNRLREFWKNTEQNIHLDLPVFGPVLENAITNWMTITTGIPAFFSPNPLALLGQHAQVGIENAAYYSMMPLRNTLDRLVDFEYINSRHMRISLGAVKISNGEMIYFDSRKDTFSVEHVMASGALPPAFPAVCVNGEFYWDGGIYSNTPLEAVLDDNPRRDSLIFTVDVWNHDGARPQSLWEVFGKEKDIQYASRAHSHIARQKQIHHLRHVILEMAKAMPVEKRESPKIKELASWGCKTTMHVVRLVAASVPGEDQLKDMDFAPANIHARWQAGYADTCRMLERAPWTQAVDPIEGLIIHEASPDAATSMVKGIDGFEGKTK